MRTLSFDILDAVRGLRRDAAFTTTAIVTLALTLAATTTVFSIVDGVLLKPLAYPQSSRLVLLHETWQEVTHLAPRLPVNERHFEYWRAHAKSFEAMAQYLPVGANLVTADGATQVSVARATVSLFEVLQVRPALGRGLVHSDDAVGQPDVAVISNALWHNEFSANPDLIGTPIVLDGRPYTVVGILPPTFRLPMGEQLIATVDAFIPLRVAVGWVGDHNDVAIGRLRDGVSREEARAELNVLQAQVSETATREAGEPVTLAVTILPLADSIVGRSRRGLVLLFAAIVAVLLIACSNLANLSLTRAAARTRDGAIRSALGASRGRLIRRVVIEQILLALTGAAAGLWVAQVALRVFVLTAPIDLPRVDEVTLDARVWAFMLAAAVVSSLLVAILPAWQAAAQDAQDVLRAGGTVVGADRAGHHSRTVLLAAQIALSVALLIVTGLLSVSLKRVLAVDTGFRADSVVAIPVALPTARYVEGPSRTATYDRVLDDIRSIAGVEMVSSTSLLPMRGEGQVNFIVAAGVDVPRAEQPTANFRFVAPDYFTTLQMPLKSGRPFGGNERDRLRPAPAVISESVATRLWPGQPALGRVFSRGIDGEQPFAVVGVAIDARTTAIEQAPPLMVYVPYWWVSRPSTTLLVRTTIAPATLAPDVRRVIRDIDPEIAVGQPRLLQELVDAATAARRYQSQLFMVFAGLALFIAMIGVYSGTAYSLSKRRREMNIRVALGARSAEVTGLVLRQTGVATLAGVVLGVVVALALGGVLASLLYDVHARDPFVLATVATLVSSAAVAAMLMATHRSLSLDPVSALRQE
jgi:predicted permease